MHIYKVVSSFIKYVRTVVFLKIFTVNVLKFEHRVITYMSVLIAF
jgi:hypothetical protein